MKKIFVICFMIAVFSGCATQADQNTIKERAQQAQGMSAILDNQPVPDLGGYSFERHIVIETFLARNHTISTYTYTMTYDGRVIEICSSVGYPIPYATELSNPLQPSGYTGVAIAQPEPNGLYPPSTAAATLVQCVNDDGSVTPTYWEQDIFALPYRVKSDIQIQRIGNSSFTVKPK